MKKQTYTTIKGNEIELNDKAWKGIRRIAFSQFDGSKELFDLCWEKYRNEILPGTDNPENINDVNNWLNVIASEEVNNPESDFFIYG
jgi:hypothetical protein